MECAICGNILDQNLHIPDLESTVDGVVSQYHSACATCYLCHKPGAMQFVVQTTGEYLFIHEECCFTPDQMDSLMEMYARYQLSQDH